MGKKLKYLAYIIPTFSAKRENVKQYLTYRKFNCLIIKYALKVKFFNMRKYSCFRESIFNPFSEGGISLFYIYTDYPRFGYPLRATFVIFYAN